MTPLGTSVNPIAFDEIARLADAGDNVAIATRRLEAGLTIKRDGTTFALDSTVMVGHRFAIEPVARLALRFSPGAFPSAPPPGRSSRGNTYETPA